MRLIFLLSFCIGIQAFAQTKLILDDRTGLISEDIENSLSEYLSTRGINYTTMLDIKNRCDYYYASLVKLNNSYFLEVRDCSDNTYGKKDLGQRFSNIPDNEKLFLLRYNLEELLENEPVSQEFVSPDEYFRQDGERQEQKEDLYIAADTLNKHKTRYFFAPSAYNLEKGELYYNTLYFGLHDLQYGITDNFSLGMGTTIIGLPVYFTPKYSIPLKNNKGTVAIGDLPIFGTWGSDFFGNLAYAAYTTPKEHTFSTFGIGHLYINQNDLISGADFGSIVLNYSGIARISGYIYFLTENYFTSFLTEQTAESFSPPVRIASFEQRQNIWYGISGFRFVNRKNEGITTLQIGLSHILIQREAVPRQYTSGSWWTSANDFDNFLVIPTITFSRKFGNKF